MFTKLIERKSNDDPFNQIIGYEDVKRLFRMALNSAKEPVHILLVGPPASAKTMFLQSFMKLHNSHFIDGGNSTKSGVIDYIFTSKPKNLLIDEIDKMSTREQSFLLNLMETGIVAETKHGKTRTATNVKTWVFATSNNISRIIVPLQSRFFIAKLEPYTYEQFYQITIELLTKQYKVKEEIAKSTAYAVWNNTKAANIRDCVKIARMTKSIEDHNFIVNAFLNNNRV
jgi:holliday junction DNA helicase RuvB